MPTFLLLDQLAKLHLVNAVEHLQLSGGMTFEQINDFVLIGPTSYPIVIASGLPKASASLAKATRSIGFSQHQRAWQSW
jgi:hypothetical protein